jgi:hypothetical protein
MYTVIEGLIRLLWQADHPHAIDIHTGIQVPMYMAESFF